MSRLERYYQIESKAEKLPFFSGAALTMLDVIKPNQVLVWELQRYQQDIESESDSRAVELLKFTGFMALKSQEEGNYSRAVDQTAIFSDIQSGMHIQPELGRVFDDIAQAEDMRILLKELDRLEV